MLGEVSVEGAGVEGEGTVVHVDAELFGLVDHRHQVVLLPEYYEFSLQA